MHLLPTFTDFSSAGFLTAYEVYWREAEVEVNCNRNTGALIGSKLLQDSLDRRFAGEFSRVLDDRFRSLQCSHFFQFAGTELRVSGAAAADNMNVLDWLRAQGSENIRRQDRNPLTRLRALPECAQHRALHCRCR